MAEPLTTVGLGRRGQEGLRDLGLGLRPRRNGRGRCAGVSIPAGARPDELEAGFALDFGERRVDGGGEARVIQLDREVVAIGLNGALLPRGSQFHITGRVDAEVWALVRRVIDALETGLDVERQSADRTGEAVLGQVSIVVCGLTF